MTLLCALILAVPGPTTIAPVAPSLVQLSSEIERTVLNRGFEAPVGVYVESASAPLSRAAASLVIAELSQHQRAAVPVIAADAAQAERLAREGALRTLVRLTLSVEPPRLVVRGDAISTWVNFWSGSTPTRSGPAVAITWSTEADPQVLTLAGTPVPPVARPVEMTAITIAKTNTWPAALTVADVDGDHRAEIVALVGDTVITWNGDGKVKARTELSGDVSVTPTREPFGFVVVSPPRLVVWSSRRARAEQFNWQKDAWRSSGPAEGLSIGPVTVTPRPGYASFGKDLVWAGKPLAWPEPVQQFAPFGGTLALVVGPTGNAATTRGQAPASLVSGVGSGSTLADLDGDGTPELVVSASRSTGDTDELRAVALAAFEAAQARGVHLGEVPTLWQGKLEGRAILAAAGDLDGDGADEIVLGVWREDGTGELSVLRKTP